MAEREKIHFTRNSSYSNPKRSKIVKITRGYVTKLNRDREKQYQSRRVKLVERDRKKVLLGSVKPNKEKNKFNFLYWITCIVLFLILGSFAITGYVNSKITENQTEETITHTYQKQIGTEIISSTFTNENLTDFSIFLNEKIYLKKESFTIDLFNDFALGLNSNTGQVIVRLPYGVISVYDENDNFIRRIPNYLQMEIHFYLNISNTNRYIYSYVKIFDSRNYYYYGFNDKGDQLTDFNYSSNNVSYLVYESFNTTSVTFYSNFSTSVVTLNNDKMVNTFNNIFYYGNSIEVPIYETTTYTYKVKDINYDWQNKFSQLGHLKNIFNGNDKFYDASFNYYSSKRSLTLNSIKDSNYVQNEIEKFYLTDEKVKLLYDYGILSFSSKSKKIVSGGNPFKSEYYFYIVLDSDIVVGDKNISSAINYVNENYITSFNIDYYLEVQPSDFSLLSIFVFPIQVVYRIMYNFGVFVNFIISW